MAQEPSAVLRGSWTARAGSRTFRGTWSAQPLPGKPDQAHGSWLLLDERNRTVAEGTWAAARSEPGWQGQWSARIPTGRSTSRVRSGTWRAGSTSNAATLADLFQQTLLQEVTGSWASAGLRGTWALRGSTRP